MVVSSATDVSGVPAVSVASVDSTLFAAGKLRRCRSHSDTAVPLTSSLSMKFQVAGCISTLMSPGAFAEFAAMKVPATARNTAEVASAETAVVP